MDAQADLHLSCLHMAKTGFLMMWLNSNVIKVTDSKATFNTVDWVLDLHQSNPDVLHKTDYPEQLVNQS